MDLLLMELKMPLSSFKPDPASYVNDPCGFCRARATAEDLIRRRIFEDALQILGAAECSINQSCTCQRQNRKEALDLNANIIGSTTESEKADVEELRSRPVAQFWSLVSCCRIERAILSERSIRSTWEDDVPKRHKKKHATCAEYFKSLSSSAAQKVPADLKSFHASCVAYLEDLKSALNAAEKSLEADPEFDEAHLHVARAVFRIENPAMGGGEERKTISATCHVSKYLKQLGDDMTVTDFNPTLWLFLKELNHALYLDAVTLSPAFDSIRFYDNVFLVGSHGPACFLDLRSAVKYTFEAGMNEVSFLISPGKYDASIGDVEVPDGTRFDVVGNVDSKVSGLRWRHVLRNLDKSVALVASSDATGFSFAGSVDVSFSRLAFVDSSSDLDALTPLVSVSENATATIDSCSFHRGEDVHNLSSVSGDVTESATSSNASAHSVGISSTSDGVLHVFNSLFFQLSNGAQIDDGGLIYLNSSTFSDTGLSASDNAVVSVESCEFVNGEFFVHNNCRVEISKSTFKRQSHATLPVSASPLTSSHCLIKIRKGSTVSVSKSRFFATRPVSLERVALDENEGLLSNLLAGGDTTAISIGGAGTHVTMDDNVFSHVDKCISASDKAKMLMSKNKFLDCGEMVNLSGLAKGSLEDNHPCARMIPLVLLDEATETPEMKGPNTYRVERRCASPPSSNMNATLESPLPVGVETQGKGRQFCHHCCGDLVRSTPKKASKEAGPRPELICEATSLPPTTPSSGKDQKKKKSRTQSASHIPPKSPKTPFAVSNRAKSVKGDSSVSNNRHALPSSSGTSLSSASATGSSGFSSSSPRNRSNSSMTPSSRKLSSSASATPSPRAVSSPHNPSSPTAFLFCACGSSYCSRDCQVEDWKDHRHVCGGKKVSSKSRKLSLDLP